MSVMFEVWGEYAAFNRPEFKTERVTYDCITPSAARGILEAVYWHPVTACFTFLSDVYGRKSAAGYVKSGAAIILYILLGILVYRVRYAKENSAASGAE